jgi:DNA integrity scanning protein DisA with diadenylate cyclase activity
MEDIKKQLQAQFNTQYEEFKEAEDFLKSYSEEKIAEFQEEVKQLLDLEESVSIEKSIEFVRDYKTIPKMLALDLDAHKERVLSAYKIVENILEFPQEQKEKIEELSKNKNKTIFIRDKGVNTVFNQAYYNSIMNSTKDQNYVKIVTDTYKRMYQDSQKK